MTREDIRDLLYSGRTLESILGKHEALKFVRENKLYIPKPTHTIGIEVEALGFIQSPPLRFWARTADGSVREDATVPPETVQYFREKGTIPYGYNCYEFRSCILKENLPEALSELGSVLTKKDGVHSCFHVTKTTGLHIHVGMNRNKSRDKALFNLFKSLEQEVLQLGANSRINNHYARSIQDKEYEDVVRNIYGRYYTLNLNTSTDGATVEFRCFLSEKNVKIIQFYAILCDLIVKFAHENEQSINDDPSFIEKVSLRDVLSNDRMMIMLNSRKEFISRKANFTKNTMKVKVKKSKTWEE